MLIRVRYDEGRFDMVKPQLLDRLLENKKVTSFKRSGGWAVIGQYPIRSKHRNRNYCGPERRSCGIFL